jgi:hypothetical protein
MTASPTPTERITGVAIVDTQGRIWALPAPRRHCHIFAMAAFLGDSAEGNMRGQGFMTSLNRFVERADALEIAKAAGQTRPGAKLGHQLYSEDLW